MKNSNFAISDRDAINAYQSQIRKALQYVSMCSILTQDEIIQIFQDYLNGHFPGESAEQKLCEFFDAENISEIPVLNMDDRREDRYQRIILVAAHFDTVVTSTVLWLLKHKVKIKCIKTTLYEHPHEHGKHVFIDIEQIIPVKEVEEYQIKLNDKRRREQLAKTNAADARGNHWTFSELNIPEGAELIFVRDKTKKCFVAGEQSVKYEGEIFPSLVALANHLWQELGLNGSPRGAPQHFRYNGTLLSKLRKGAEQ